MLPSGPRSTYRLPSTPQLDSRELAKQIMASIKAAIEKSKEVRIGTASFGCDGRPVINPLDETDCNDADTGTDACSLVLYNPQTRSVFGDGVGRAFSSTAPNCAPAISRTVTIEATCLTILAKLEERRRFVDNVGNWYGPDGAWLSGGHTPATLGTEYVHEMLDMRTVDGTGDPPVWKAFANLYLQKTSGAAVSLRYTDRAQGTVWPSIDDAASSEILTNDVKVTGLNDATFGGTYTGTDVDRSWRVFIDGTGSPNTFKWTTVTSVPASTPVSGSFTTGVPITGEAQDLSLGVTVTFGALTGHTNNDEWLGSVSPNNDIVRSGVGARGTVAVASSCVDVNSNLLVTAECRVTLPNGTTTFGAPASVTAGGSHALVVRNADTLALLYRKELTRDVASLIWGDPPQKFSFSTNDEGLFFLQCYTTPSIAVPGSPYPGNEFGSPDPRKVAVISVNPLTFEPTIDELITLGADPTGLGSFVTAFTLP